MGTNNSPRRRKKGEWTISEERREAYLKDQARGGKGKGRSFI